MSETIGQTWEEELLARGEARATLRILRGTLRELLEERFGALPDPLVQQIETTGEVERLNRAIRKVIRLTSLDEFQL